MTINRKIISNDIYRIGALIGISLLFAGLGSIANKYKDNYYNERKSYDKVQTDTIDTSDTTNYNPLENKLNYEFPWITNSY